ncbi:MAG TPA: site-specific DNA-methyltransferase [Gammaproteobacteria bacterium]|nr:site-specific DNA-methyltransferase [Gammaproteobacteria bacterium]
MSEEQKTNRLKMHSPDLTEANIEKLAELFPNCVTKAQDEDGNLKQAIDFDQLRQELSDHVVDGPRERYQLNWPGKREALLAANAPIAKTLRPCRDESVDFDTTKNLFIEGDNLNALKLLQETYLNKVKMIFIDPPYNTGSDLIYDDSFRKSAEEYAHISGQESEERDRLVANPESSGRYHSDWLSMMYPRLRLARNVLHDEGVIFVTIDDHEVPRLRQVMDEVFGRESFLACFLWKKMDSPSRNDKHRIASDYHDYVVAYKRNRDSRGLAQRAKPEILEAYPLVMDDGRRARRRQLRKNGKAARREDRPTMWYKLTAPDGTDVWPVAPPPDSWEGRWSLKKESWLEKEEAGLTEWIKRDNGWVPYVIEFAPEDPSVPWSTWWDDLSQNRQAKAAFTELMKGSRFTFDNPKPVDLVERLISIVADKQALIMDFFAGSGTTAQAVMQANANDAGGRRFVLVQLPECHGQEWNLCDLVRERICRAGENIKADARSSAETLDIGFRVLKVENTNMKDVYYTPDSVRQDGLFGQIDNIKEDRRDEDLLFQVLLDWGVDLSLTIESEKIAGKIVYFVDENALAACFEADIDEDFVKALAERKPLRVVFRDSGYGNDSTKINVEQIFKLISPTTEVRTI